MNTNWPEPQEFWSKRRVCVTGGAGFLGSFVVEKLRRRGAADIFVPTIDEYDLVKLEDIRRVLDASRPDVIFHLAAPVLP
jgi:GDP-L-fucose synthase